MWTACPCHADSSLGAETIAKRDERRKVIACLELNEFHFTGCSYKCILLGYTSYYKMGYSVGPIEHSWTLGLINYLRWFSDEQSPLSFYGLLK